jgi:hypothetical protein
VVALVVAVFTLESVDVEVVDGRQANAEVRKSAQSVQKRKRNSNNTNKKNTTKKRTFAFWQRLVPPCRRGGASDGSLESAARVRERHTAQQRSGGGMAGLGGRGMRQDVDGGRR